MEQTYYLQYDRVLLRQNGGFDFPQWHLITVTALQLHSSEVSHGQRQSAAPFSFYALACLAHTVDRWLKKNRPTQVVSDTPVFYAWTAEEKRYKTHKGEQSGHGTWSSKLSATLLR